MSRYQFRTVDNWKMKLRSWKQQLMIPFQYESPSSLLAREEREIPGSKDTKLKGFGLGGAPGRAPTKVKRPDQMPATLRRIWGYLATYRVKLISVLIMIVLATGFSL